MPEAGNILVESENFDKILITGISGFIGGHVARYFVEHGHKVVGLVREKSDLGFIRDLPVSLVIGDITDLESLVSAFRDIDVIVHIAGRVNDWGKYEDFYAVNVTGTMNVLQAAAQNSISRVIITGTNSSYGEENHEGLKDEESPFNPHYPYFLDRWFPSAMNHYRDTKAICTQFAEEFSRRHSMDITVIEPVWVYGENEFSSGFYEYLKSVSSGFPVMPGRKTNNFHVVYAGDLARAYFLAYKVNLKGFHKFIIGNREPENMLAIYRTFCRQAGYRNPILLPRFITYPIGLLLESIYTAFGSKKPPLLTRGRVNMFYDNIGYSSSKAKDILGFESLIPIEEGVLATVRWYKENNYL